MFFSRGRGGEGDRTGGGEENEAGRDNGEGQGEENEAGEGDDDSNDGSNVLFFF